jgi:hypothetical protein
MTKSQVSFYAELLINTYLDMVGALCVQNEQQRDIEEIRHRAAHEGLSFLTKTLPRLGKAIDRSLSSGSILQTTNFKLKRGTGLPCFMGTILSILFEPDGRNRFATDSLYPHKTDIRLKEDAAENQSQCSGNATSYCRETAVNALTLLRQVCFMFYKLETPYSKSQEDRVLADFVETERELDNLVFPRDSRTQFCLGVARNLIYRVLCNASPMSGKPRHGPGAVATGEKPVEKHHFKRYYRRLAKSFSYDDWFFYNNSHLSDHLEDFLKMEEIETGTAKVVLVPKDSRGPRLISCEPLEYQWIQQSLMSVLTQTIETHPWTSGRVNFTRQDINQQLALEGSKPPYKWCTLDMKEASDRVSLELVKALFPPQWYDALFACRTPATQLPNGNIVNMKKFAPMGSAVCFPVEALVFWALSVAAVHQYTNKPLRNVASQIFVYGDDIICNTDDHGVITDILERFGLKLNRDKCCVAGPYKESCGMDAFLGAPVTPLRIRTTWSSHRKPSSLASYVAFHNACYKRGMLQTCQYILEHIQNIWNWTIPIVSDEDLGCIAFVRFDTGAFHSQRRWKTRFNARLHRREVLGLQSRASTIMSKSAGWELMLRVFSEHGRHQSSVPARRSITGEYPITHRDKLRRVWTAYP